MSTVGSVARLAITVVLLADRASRRCSRSRCSRCRPWWWRRGARAPSARCGRSSPRAAGSTATCSTSAPPRAPARRSGSPASAIAWRGCDGRPGRPGTARSRGNRTVSASWTALAWALFGAAYVGAIVAVATVLGGTAGDVLLVLAAGANLSRYLGMTAAQADFLRWCVDAASRLVWLERYADAHRAPRRRAGAGPHRARHSRREACRSSIPAPTSGCCATSISSCRPARWSRSSARTAPARPRWSSCCAASTSRPRAGSLSTASISRDCRPKAGASGSAGAFQDFMRFELQARIDASAWATCRAVDDQAAVESAVERGGAGDVVRACRAASTPSSVRPGAKASSSRSVSGRSSRSRAGSCATSRCCWCSTSRPRRSTPRPSTLCSSASPRRRGPRPRPAASPSWCRTASRRCGWPTSSSCSTAAGWPSVGSHEELMARGGLYAELYGIQARAYA